MRVRTPSPYSKERTRTLANQRSNTPVWTRKTYNKRILEIRVRNNPSPVCLVEMSKCWNIKLYLWKICLFNFALHAILQLLVNVVPWLGNSLFLCARHDMQFNNKKYVNPGGARGDGHSKNWTMYKYADPFKFDSCKNFATNLIKRSQFIRTGFENVFKTLHTQQ